MNFILFRLKFRFWLLDHILWSALFVRFVFVRASSCHVIDQVFTSPHDYFRTFRISTILAIFTIFATDFQSWNENFEFRIWYLIFSNCTIGEWEFLKIYINLVCFITIVRHSTIEKRMKGYVFPAVMKYGAGLAHDVEQRPIESTILARNTTIWYLLMVHDPCKLIFFNSKHTFPTWNLFCKKSVII